MWCRYRQHTNLAVPVVLCERNLILIKYHIEVILEASRASNLFSRLAGFIRFDDDDLDTRPRTKVYNSAVKDNILEDMLRCDLAMDGEHGILIPLGATYTLVPDDRYSTTVELCNVVFMSDQDEEVDMRNLIIGDIFSSIL